MLPSSGLPKFVRPDSASRHGRAFTLLEVLLVVAIIGLLAAVLVGGAAQLMNDKPQTPDEVFWNSVQEARKMALKSERDVWLKYDDQHDKVKAFIVTDGSDTKTFVIPEPGDLEVSFLSQQKSGNLIMVAGTVIDTKKLEAVTFYADGTCSAFRAQFFQKGGAHTATIDPWTCAPVLTPTDENGIPVTRP